jgi:hypothetical protein
MRSTRGLYPNAVPLAQVVFLTEVREIAEIAAGLNGLDRARMKNFRQMMKMGDVIGPIRENDRAEMKKLPIRGDLLARQWGAMKVGNQSCIRKGNWQQI